jgi:hypothetical protein
VLAAARLFMRSGASQAGAPGERLHARLRRSSQTPVMSLAATGAEAVASSAGGFAPDLAAEVVCGIA